MTKHILTVIKATNSVAIGYLGARITDQNAVAVWTAS